MHGISILANNGINICPIKCGGDASFAPLGDYFFA